MAVDRSPIVSSADIRFLTCCAASRACSAAVLARHENQMVMASPSKLARSPQCLAKKSKALGAVYQQDPPRQMSI